MGHYLDRHPRSLAQAGRCQTTASIEAKPRDFVVDGVMPDGISSRIRLVIIDFSFPDAKTVSFGLLVVFDDEKNDSTAIISPGWLDAV
ncbi:hypothetical protein ColLi_09127 [Colletotrichum liriopes]|uniref:Uncharacterized protein n=1 Tax=Colletotrichum liriopes TaxID=708192 RepID=A0AA37LVH0_9PEZI|nr:hypothetical protein ColLi_09127 [Colletotrichum liriopes]